ncbi:hypothetical protein CTKZ_31460 [Cellulomonas algicola]|uniref:Uncharacterized protein n=1 Tax=Cellulomonas algicola TaxID=2071633 RepID=A0A401V3V6_9CELL|nr:hypothetical protein CTKZ_31460 [Cellulomonas algicola]
MNVAPRRTIAEDSRRRPMKVNVGAEALRLRRRGACAAGAAVAAAGAGARLFSEVTMGS